MANLQQIPPTSTADTTQGRDFSKTKKKQKELRLGYLPILDWFSLARMEAIVFILYFQHENSNYRLR